MTYKIVFDDLWQLPTMSRPLLCSISVPISCSFKLGSHAMHTRLAMMPDCVNCVSLLNIFSCCDLLCLPAGCFFVTRKKTCLHAL